VEDFGIAEKIAFVFGVVLIIISYADKCVDQLIKLAKKIKKGWFEIK